MTFIIKMLMELKHMLFLYVIIGCVGVCVHKLVFGIANGCVCVCDYVMHDLFIK